MWPCAKAAQEEAVIFSALASVVERRLELSPWALANIAWPGAKAAQEEAVLFSALASVAERRPGEFSL